MITSSIIDSSQVTLHFSLKLLTGDFVENNFDKKPAEFTMGDGSLLPGFERKLLGLKQGDKRIFDIVPEQGFGAHKDQNIQVMNLDQFEGIELSIGLLIIFNDFSGSELPGVVMSFDDNKVTIDFNHPLAGKDLKFEVEIISIS
ncbi:UNVERIFIED_CONTAM: hypothetical protein GTU68_052163 [Idotea baltica]|nr:hypothetical protein [Idotea baltica]